MKPTRSLLAFLFGSVFLAGQAAHAATYYWDGTSASWNTVDNWSTASGATTPNPAALSTVLDDLIFNITTANGAESITLDANQAARSLAFNNTDTTTLLGGGSARTLTLGTGGITIGASAGAVTLGDGTANNDVLLSLTSGAQTWTNNSAANFTINNTSATLSRASGAALIFNQVGAGSFAVASGVSNDATGIIGPWAFYGTGASQRYATVSGGNIIGYTGGTAAADANALTSATTNYDLTSAAVTLSASRTANTLRYAGAGGAIDLGSTGANTLTLNGILAVGASGTLTVQRTGGTGTVTFGSSNELVIAGSQNVTISAPISGTGKTLTYAGTGTLTLSGANTFTGTLNVASGTLASSNTSLQALTTNIAAGAIYNGSYGFGTNPSFSAPWTVNGTFNKSGNGSITFGSGAPISGTGTINLGLGGQITVTMNGNNSGFTGTINESTQAGGGVILGNHNALGAGTWVFESNSNAYSSSIANFSNPNATALRFSGDRTFSGSNNMNLGTGAVTLNGANRTITVTGITLTLGGAVGQDVAGRALTKAGTGTLVLSGTGSTYSGATVINAGNLDLGGSTANGSLASPTLTLGGGTFSYTRTGTNTQSFTTTNFNSAPANVLTVASGNTLNLGSIVRGAGVFYDFSTVSGGGTVGASTSNNSAAGIMSPYFTHGDSWAVAAPAGVTAYSGYTLTSVAGTTAANYTANNIDVDSSEGALSGGITTNSIRFSSAAANTLTLTGANVISSGGILVASTVGNNLSTITGGTSLTGPASGDLVIQQNNTSGGLTIASNIINNTATTLNKLGDGTLTLSGTNTYTGTTTIYGGTLAVSGGAAIANTGLVTLANTVGVTFQLNNSETIGNLSGGGTTGGTVALGSNTLTVGDANNQTYSGNFTGTSGSSIIKQGSGTLTLAATSTSIPGTATINAGMLGISSTAISGGTITLGANSSGLLFTGGGAAGVSGAGGTTISNNIVLGNGVTTTGARLWATANSGRFNFTGNITGAAGAAGAQTLLFDTRGGAGTGGDRHTTTISGVIDDGNQALNLNFAITPQSASSAANNHPTYVNLTAASTFTGNITATRGNAGATSWLVIGGERWSDGPNNTPTYGRMGSGRLGDDNSGVYAGNFALGGTAGNIVNLAYFSSANQTWSGTIGTGGVNNNGALVKEGTGTLTLTGASTFNSLTTIGGGTLALAFNTGVTTSNILPSTTPLWMGLGTVYDPISANADMTISGGGGGGTLQLAGNAASATQTVASLNVSANTANRIVVGADRTLTITSGTVTAGANSGLNFNTAAGGNNGATVGTSIVAFGAAPTFTNGFTVTDSTGFGLAAVNGSNQVIRNTSTTLLPASSSSSTTDYRVDNNGGGGGAAGSSTLAITASQATKSITVDTGATSGTLTLNSGVVLSNSIWNFGAASGSNTYQISGNASGAGVRTTATGEAFVINNFNAGTVTYNSPILAFGTNALIVGGTGTVVLNGLNTFTGATTINGGNLQIGSTGRLVGGAYAGAIAINGGSVFQYSGSNAQTLSGVISGPGGITKDTNTSTLTLSNAANLYTGTTTVSAGRIQANSVGSLSSGATSVVQSGIGQVYINAAGTYANPFNISGTGFAEPGDSQNNINGAIRLDNASNLSGTITLSGDSRIGKYNNSTSIISGQITGGYGIDFYGFQDVNNAAPTFVLSNQSNNYTGATTIYNSNYNSTNRTGVSTTLKLGNSNVIPDGASAGNVAFAINGTNNNATVIFDLNGFNETINGLTVNAGTFATRITNTGSTNSVLTIGANNTISSFNGTITDSGAGRTLAINKTGTGALTISGPNTYIGATTVSAGTLIVSGAGTINTSSSITVAAGGALRYNSSTALTVAPTLSGNGASNRAVFGGGDSTGTNGLINASLTLNDPGDTLSPGNSPGILPFGVGQTWDSFSYDWELNDWAAEVAGTNIDVITVNGTLDLAATSADKYLLNILSLTGGNVAGALSNFAETPQSWTILSATSITGFVDTEWDINAGGFLSDEGGTWSIDQSGNTLVLTYAPIPEPGAALLGGLGILLILRRRR